MSELHLMYRLGLLLRAEYRVVRKAWRRRVRRWRLRNWYPPIYQVPTSYAGLNNLLKNCYTNPLNAGLQNAYARIEGQHLGLNNSYVDCNSYHGIDQNILIDCQRRNQQQLGGLDNALADAIPGLGLMIGY